MKKLSSLILFVLLFQISFAHPWKPSHYIVIDTDAGIDDMRAISMLLASDDVQILGIIVSGGALSPYDGYKKIKSMLNSYHHEGVPIAMNYNIRGQDLPLPMAIDWGDENGIEVPETNGFNKLLKNILKHETAKFSLLSFASLNSAAELIGGGVLPAERIKELIWSNNSLNKLGGFNAGIDIRSANKIIKGDIPLTVVAYPSDKSFYDDLFLEELKNLDSKYSRKIVDIFDANVDIANHQYALSAADEMSVIYLHYPELFRATKVKNNQFFKPISGSQIKEHALLILSGKTINNHQVIKNLPADTSFYQADLQPYIKEIRSRYGEEEWEAGVLSSEMHRHLGIYSIIGVKMGIRAREYFDVGVDEMKVKSSAGSIPPVSCLNDGLQLSTGATSGHGLLSLADTDQSAYATFTYNWKSIEIKLKDEIVDEINKELKDLSIVNGLDSDIYWDLVRQRAILYWKNLDRMEIFEIMILENR